MACDICMDQLNHDEEKHANMSMANIALQPYSVQRRRHGRLPEQASA